MIDCYLQVAGRNTRVGISHVVANFRQNSAADHAWRNNVCRASWSVRDSRPHEIPPGETQSFRAAPRCCIQLCVPPASRCREWVAIGSADSFELSERVDCQSRTQLTPVELDVGRFAVEADDDNSAFLPCEGPNTVTRFEQPDVHLGEGVASWQV